MAKAKKKTSAKAARDKALIQLNVFDGTRQPFPAGKDLLVRISDGSQRQLEDDFFKKATIRFAVPFSDNFKDNYTVLVTCDGYRDAGFFPVKVSPDLAATVDLMLVPKKAKYQFLTWNQLKANYRRFADFLNCEDNEVATKGHYEELPQDRPASLASMLNLTAAMSAIHLPRGTPLDYFKQIEWDA